MNHHSARSGHLQSQRSPLWTWGGIAAVAIAVLIAGYVGLGSAKQSAHNTNLTSPTIKASRFPTNYRALALTSGKQVPVVRGRRLTVVMLMASWCLYCAYEDKYVWPQVVRSIPGVEVNIVDVSPNGGIGDPGPQSPPFTGHDNFGLPISVAGMRQTMITYRKRFGLQVPHIHVFVDPSGLNYWHVTSFPTLLFVNSTGHLVQRINGALTKAQITTLIRRLEH